MLFKTWTHWREGNGRSVLFFPDVIDLFISFSYWLVGHLFVRVFNDILVKLNVIRWKLRRQGIRGPPPSFVTGNIPEMRRIMSMAKAPSSESPPPLDFFFAPNLPLFQYMDEAIWYLQ